MEIDRASQQITSKISNSLNNYVTGSQISSGLMDLGLTFYLINIEYLFAPTIFRTFQWHMFKWMFLRISFLLNTSSIFHSNLLSLSYIFHVSAEKSSSQLDGILWLWFETDVLLGAFQLDQYLPIQPLNSH